VGGGGKNANDDMILAMRIFVVPLDGVFDTGLAPLQAGIRAGPRRLSSAGSTLLLIYSQTQRQGHSSFR
jgi:hypothetical protein